MFQEEKMQYTYQPVCNNNCILTYEDVVSMDVNAYEDVKQLVHIIQVVVKVELVPREEVKDHC